MNGPTAQALHKAPWAHVTRQEARATRARVYSAHAAGGGAGLETRDSPPALSQDQAGGLFENENLLEGTPGFVEVQHR